MIVRPITRPIIGLAALAVLAACSPADTAATTDASAEGAAAPATGEVPAQPPEVVVTEASFRCIRDMTPVRGFFVDNLLGDVAASVAVAESPTGGTYPPGTLIQPIPTVAMVKHQPGHNPETKDWEFMELAVTAEGATFVGRGFAELNTSFGANCFNCHKVVEPAWDMICERTHGCGDIPLTPVAIRALQNTDPRCPEIELPPEQAEALAAPPPPPPAEE